MTRIVIGTRGSQLALWQANYASLLEFFQQSDINYISIIEPAGVPTRPISPKTELNVLLAGIVGLMISLESSPMDTPFLRVDIIKDA